MIIINTFNVGDKIGHLTIIDEYIGKKHRTVYKCQCDCGNIRFIDKHNFQKRPSYTCKDTQNCKYAQEHYSKIRRRGNKYDLSGEYGIGYTNVDNKEFYFDLEDYDKIKDYTWYLDDSGYVRTNIFDFEQNRRSHMFMHNLIMNLQNDNSQIADHIGGVATTNDNRKSNLRIVTKSQNNINQRIRKDNTSGFKGISYNKQLDKWRVRIQKDGKRIYIGDYNSLEEASLARMKAEDKYFGDYSYRKSMELANGNS